MVEHAVEVVEIGQQAQLLDQRSYPLGTDLGRAEHDAQVTIEQFGRA
jgi:hypothetical protein